MTRGTRTIVGAVVALAIVAGVGWLIFGGGSDGPVVNVYSARSHYGTEAVFDRFTEETGIKVEIYGGEPGPLVDRIKAEGERTKADLLITVETDAQAIEASELFFQYYRENSVYLERTYDFVERLGIEKVRRETVYAADEVKKGLLERLRKSKEQSYDAWLERHTPRPTQFVQIQPMEAV